jgi:hypothetical protein
MKTYFTDKNSSKRKLFTVAVFIFVLFLIHLNKTFSQTYYYFQDSPDNTFYDFSWLTVNAPSELEITGYDNHRFPVETATPPEQGLNSLRMHWLSAPGGDWEAIAAGMDWTEKNISNTDTLLFFFYSPDGISNINLPKVFLEDIFNVKTTAFSIGTYTNDLPAGQWVRITIPMHIFFEAGDPVDFTKIKTVGYSQDVADNVTHTLFVDDVRVQKGDGTSPPVSVPTGLTAKGYDSHVFLTWHPNPEPNVNGYEIYRSNDGGLTFSKTAMAGSTDTMYTDFVRIYGTDLSLKYRITAVNDINVPSGFSDTVSTNTYTMTDDELLTMVQEATFRYFWDFGHPVSGLARERNTSGETVTIGGSGFGIMAIPVAIERGFITREQGIQRMLKILNFLENADRFHGAWSHWLDGTTGHVIPFSQYDDGGDLVETSYMIQALLTVRQYFSQSTPDEQSIVQKITALWESVEWDWYRQNNQNVLYWHWSPNYNWKMNMQIRGWNECMIVYLLAIASPTHGVPASLWTSGWAGNSGYTNGQTFYGIRLDVGWNYGGPLFFAHYSFLGFDARHKKDMFTNYFINNAHDAQIDHQYCITNPYSFTGYSEKCWGLTASDDPTGYIAHQPYYQDNGTISPTAALSSIVYTPAYSMEALIHFYRDRGDKLWGNFGFFDAFNLKLNWYASSYLAIDQGPIIDMIENYRTGLLWNLFMANPEIQPMLDAIGFTFDSNTSVAEIPLNPDLYSLEVNPNPVSDKMSVSFVLPESAEVNICLMDMMGRIVMPILNEKFFQAGFSEIIQDLGSLSTGIYILKMETRKGQGIKKILIHRQP